MKKSYHGRLSVGLLLGGLFLVAAVMCRAHPFLNDYDGDDVCDLAVYWPAAGNWYVVNSGSGTTRVQNWGWHATQPVPGDYDKDGKTDLAVYWRASGNWYIVESGTGTTRVQNWGWHATQPVPGDYDKDGKTDLAVYWPEAGNWYIVNSGSGTTRVQNWGWSAAEPVPGDYDGDGKTDLAVYWPAAGNWYIVNSGSGTTRVQNWGWSDAWPVPGDYDGDGKTDLAVYWPAAGNWYIVNSGSGTTRVQNWGWSAAQPVPGDYDKDGKTDLAVYWPEAGNWYIVNSGTGTTRVQNWGWPDARPVVVLPWTSALYEGATAKTRLSDVRTWVYNIQDVDSAQQRKELVGTHFDMYVLEPCVTEQGNAGFDMAGLVRDIRLSAVGQTGKDPLILAYVDVGQAEAWRWYWKSGWKVGNPAWIVAGDPDGWDDCYPVAYWNAEWQNIVITGSGGMSHVEAALQAGFDGIYMDWVEAFCDERVVEQATEDGVADPAAAMLDFIEKIRVYARALSPNANPDFVVVAQNAPDLYETNPARYEALIDAIACEAIWYDGDGGFDDWSDPSGYNVPTDDVYPGWTQELLDYLEPMKGRLPIFCCEYAQDVGGVNRATRVYTTLAPAHGFIPYCTRRSLARLSTTPAPPGH